MNKKTDGGAGPPLFSKPGFWFWLVLGFVSICRFIYISLVQISGDEAYLWQWTRHLDWCFYDQPAFIAYQIKLTTSLFGDNAFGIRFASPLYSGIMAWLIYHWCREVWEDGWIGVYAGFIFLFIPVTALGAVYTSVDIGLAMWWLLATYSLWRAVNCCSRVWWYIAGLFFLAGLMTKYLMLFWLPAVAIYLLWDERTRKWWKRIDPYLMVLIGALYSIPFFIWNVKNDWAVVAFNFSRRHTDTRLTLDHAGQLLGTQFLLASPIILVCLVFAFVRAFRKARSSQDTGGLYKLLLVMSLTAMAILLILSIRLRVGPHWAAVGYSCAAMILALWIRDRSAGLRKGRKIAVNAGLVLALIIVISVKIFVFYPDKFAALAGDFLKYANRPAKIDESRLKDFYGWEEMAVNLNRIYNEMNAEEPAFVIGSSTAFISLAAYYSPDHLDPLLYREKGDDGELYGETSAHGLSYLFWQDLEGKIGQNALYVTDKMDDRNIRRFSRKFERWELADQMPVIHKGRELRRFYFFKGYGFKGI